MKWYLGVTSIIYDYRCFSILDVLSTSEIERNANHNLRFNDHPEYCESECKDSSIMIFWCVVAKFIHKATANVDHLWLNVIVGYVPIFVQHSP